MAYLTVAELKTYYLEQLNETAEHDGALRHYLDAATAMIDTELGFSFSASDVGAEVVYGDGTTILTPPAFTLGTTVVTAPSGYSVPTYVEYGDSLWVADSSDVLVRPYPPRLSYEGWYGHVWATGVPYTVAATFTYGDVPDDVKHVCGEITVQLWRRRDSGGTEVLGVEGASAVTIRNSLSPLSRAVLDAHKRTRNVHIGVW